MALFEYLFIHRRLEPGNSFQKIVSQHGVPPEKDSITANIVLVLDLRSTGDQVVLATSVPAGDHRVYLRASLFTIGVKFSQEFLIAFITSLGILPNLFLVLGTGFQLHSRTTLHGPTAHQ